MRGPCARMLQLSFVGCLIGEDIDFTTAQGCARPCSPNDMVSVRAEVSAVVQRMSSRPPTGGRRQRPSERLQTPSPLTGTAADSVSA